MKYTDLYLAIKEIAQRFGVQTIVPEDVQKLNADAIFYPALCVQLKSINVRSADTYDLYDLALTYAEPRGAQRNGEINESVVYSRGNTLIRIICKELEKRAVAINSAVITPYIYKFRDECVGIIGEINCAVVFDNSCYLYTIDAENIEENGKTDDNTNL